MSVLVIGAAGFLGQHLVRHFYQRTDRVIGIDCHAEENAPTEFLSSYHAMQLPDSRLESLLASETPDLIVHAAGRASVPLSVKAPKRDFDGNTVLTFHLVDAVRRCSPNSKFVLLSSAAVYGNPETRPTGEDCPISPISPYGFHKRQAELICEEFAVTYGMSTCSIRIFSAYGPGLRRQVVWDLTRKASSADTLELVGIGDESRDFVHARDVVEAVRCVAEKAPLRGEVYNVASGSERRIQDLATEILRALNRDIPLHFSGELPAGVPSRWQADISKIQKLGFEVKTDWRKGVHEFVAWAKPLLR